MATGREEMAPPLCRWGILGTANIARKNWKAIRNAVCSALVAVASQVAVRRPQKSSSTSALPDVPLTPVPLPCASYEELLARKDVDAVYIPLPTGIRKEWVLRARNREEEAHHSARSPAGVTADDVRAMLDACRQHNVQFMDGVMFMHSYGSVTAFASGRSIDGRSIGTFLAHRQPVQLQGGGRLPGEQHPRPTVRWSRSARKLGGSPAGTTSVSPCGRWAISFPSA